VLEAGCALVNCMPIFIARESYWQRRFEEKGLPIIGDDIKSQVGATITHRVLTSLFRERGVRLDKTMQLNVGGNSDFLNMLERERLESKKISKTNAVTSMLDYDLGAKNVHVGPSDYVPWLTDRKWAYIRMEGSSFAWSQPHDVNEHVAGVAGELRALGHTVVVLASSNRARDLAAGRRALLDGLDADVVTVGPAVPISRRSRIGVPVGARANLALALALGRFDIVHGFEPGLPSLSYLALRDAQAMTVATFLNAERLG